MLESGFEHLAVARMRGRIEVMHHSCPGQLQTVQFPSARLLSGTRSTGCLGLACLRRFDLRFNGFTIPSPRHTLSVPQMYLGCDDNSD